MFAMTITNTSSLRNSLQLNSEMNCNWITLPLNLLLQLRRVIVHTYNLLVARIICFISDLWVISLIYLCVVVLSVVDVITMFGDITVCAVAQHCYNGDVSFLWEKWKLWRTVKSKPLNRLTHNLSRLITSTRGTFVPNLVKIRSRGTSGQRGEI